MTDTKTRIMLTTLLLLGSVAVYGQSPDSNILQDQELANARMLLQAGRADIIREELRMSDEEASEFWLVYEKYNAELLVVRDRQAKMVAELLRRYRAGSMTNEYAKGLISDNFAIKRDLLKIQENFVRQFEKVLPTLKVARFYQLENKMDAEVDAQLALFVPLIEAM